MRHRSLLLLIAAFLLSSLGGVPTWAQKRTLCVHGVVAPQALNVRSGPGREHAILGTFAAKSCDVRLVGRCDAGWCEMEQGSVKGWVDTRNIGVYEVPSGKSAAGEPKLIDQPIAGQAKIEKSAPPAPPVKKTQLQATAPATVPPAPSDRTGPANPPRAAAVVIGAPRVEYVEPPQRRPTRPVLVEQGSNGPGACVSRVERWDTLRIRRGPGIDHREIGEIPSRACGVDIVGGCRGSWCPVAWRGRTGWVNTYYLD